jgi:hypothetical protein
MVGALIRSAGLERSTALFQMDGWNWLEGSCWMTDDDHLASHLCCLKLSSYFRAHQLSSQSSRKCPVYLTGQ